MAKGCVKVDMVTISCYKTCPSSSNMCVTSKTSNASNAPKGWNDMRMTSKTSNATKGNAVCQWMLFFTSVNFTFSFPITVSQGQG